MCTVDSKILINYIVTITIVVKSLYCYSNSSVHLWLQSVHLFKADESNSVLSDDSYVPIELLYLSIGLSQFSLELSVLS